MNHHIAKPCRLTPLDLGVTLSDFRGDTFRGLTNNFQVANNRVKGLFVVRELVVAESGSVPQNLLCGKDHVFEIDLKIPGHGWLLSLLLTGGEVSESCE